VRRHPEVFAPGRLFVMTANTVTAASPADASDLLRIECSPTPEDWFT
jgi:hypothetical protein